jgi:site-specific recombinase XerD
MDLSYVEPFDAAHLSGLSSARRVAYLRLLREFDPWLCAAAPTLGDAEALRWFLKRQLDDGYSASTVRKHLAMAHVFFEWGYEHRHVDAATLLAVRAVRLPVASARVAVPQPYRPSELRALRTTLDQRWPKLADDEAEKWLRRYSDGRSPYSRVRSHGIRCQLDAIIMLALHLGLRRREIFALDVVMAHPDNDSVVVWGDDARSVERARAVPWTVAARAAMSAWIDCRYAIAPEHDRLWLNLHAEPTIMQPMKAETFNRALATYIGRGWTLKQLRDTCAAGWVRAGLPLGRLRELLGLARIEDTLPYARLVGGSLEGRMVELDEHFCELIGPATTTDLAA